MSHVLIETGLLFSYTELIYPDIQLRVSVTFTITCLCLIIIFSYRFVFYFIFVSPDLASPSSSYVPNGAVMLLIYKIRNLWFYTRARNACVNMHVTVQFGHVLNPSTSVVASFSRLWLCILVYLLLMPSLILSLIPSLILYIVPLYCSGCLYSSETY